MPLVENLWAIEIPKTKRIAAEALEQGFTLKVQFGLIEGSPGLVGKCEDMDNRLSMV